MPAMHIISSTVGQQHALGATVFTQTLSPVFFLVRISRCVHQVVVT